MSTQAMTAALVCALATLTALGVVAVWQDAKRLLPVRQCLHSRRFR